MQFDLEQAVRDIERASDIATIQTVVDALDKEISLNGDVGGSTELVQKLAATARKRMDELVQASNDELAESQRRLALITRANAFDKSVITADFLREFDGQVAWLRDDYLSMHSVSGSSDPKLVQFLDHVAKVKAQAKADGYAFTA